MGRKRPFFLCPNFQPKCCLIHRSNMNKKGYDGDPWPLVVLRMLLSSFCFQSKFWFEQGMALSGTYSTLAWYSCESCWISMHHGVNSVFLRISHPNVIWKLGFQGSPMDMYITCVSPLLTCMLTPLSHGLYLQNTSSKDKIIKISR